METGRDQDQNPVVKLSSAPPGSRIFGKFRLLANLGAGGMGEVFLALSRSSLGGVNKLVVIKRLRHFAEDEVRSEARQMFLNEARLATLLNHPNIVQTNDVGVEDGHMYLTMEYLEGQPLNAIAKAAKAAGRRIDDALVLRIISDALAGLHYAHELRDYEGSPLCIVHRDLSPHNLFVTYEGITKVVDFGIAKSAGSSKTEQGIIKGKFAYMAPEQASDEKVDRRADVFVMGIVLWELLTGERLVFRRNDVQTVNRLLNDKFPPPSSVKPEISPELDAVVMKALAKDPSLRYQTAREMREAIEEYLVARSHPVRQEEIGPLVSELFSEERSVIRQRIRQCIATAPEDASTDNLPALTGKLNDSAVTPNGARPDGHSGAHVPLSGTLAATTSGTPSLGTPVAQPRGKGPLIAGIGVAVAALAAVAIYGTVSRHPRPAAPVESTQAAQVMEPPKAAPPPATAVATATAAAAEAPRPVETAEEAAAKPASSPHRSGGSARWNAPPPRPAPPAPPPATTTVAAPPPPPPAASSTAHARVFNTSL